MNESFKVLTKGRLHVTALTMNDVTSPVPRHFIGDAMCCDS